MGSLNMDLSLETKRFPQAGETLMGENYIASPGGKGENQAIAAAYYGSDVKILGAVGDDHFGEEIKLNLKKFKVDVSNVLVKSEARTGVAFITVAHTDNTIVVSPGANALVNEDDVDRFLEDAQEGDIFVSQLELPLSTVSYALQIAKNRKMKTILNPSPATDKILDVLPLCDFLIPNQSELFILRDTIDVAKASKQDTALNTIVTLGDKGVHYIDEDVKFKAYEPENAIDTTGAGDCFIGAFASMIARGEKVIHAVDFARCAASLSCQKRGTSEALRPFSEVEKAMEK